MSRTLQVKAACVLASLLGFLGSCGFGTNPASPAGLEVGLFRGSEVDRSSGCTVALWKAGTDPDHDELSYVFVERLDEDHVREPARIKIGRELVPLVRIATGGDTNGYDLFESQLYAMPGANGYVVLALDLGALEGEAVAIEGGTMTITTPGASARIPVEGGAGCVTPAAPPPEDDFSNLFYRYDVTEIPTAFVQKVLQTFDCDPEFMATGVTGFQMSEESAIWQIPCERFAYQTTAVFAHVDLFDPTQNTGFLRFEAPPGRRRSNDSGVLTSPRWNLATRTVTSVALGRGTGDCGTLERHRVTPQGQFALVEYREQVACDGTKTTPEEFPLVFEAP